MATFRHPITGVELNNITLVRKALSYRDAVTVHVLFRQGVSKTDIAHKLGTNPARVCDVLSGRAHPKAADEARRLLRDDLFAA